MKCAIFVTILENHFTTNDEKSEISYRFPLRMTKYLGKGYDGMFKQIRKFYYGRSAYYHTGNSKFKPGDFDLLERLASKIVIDFILNPDKFQGKEFDKLLLGFK